jgi:hypothetical protein
VDISEPAIVRPVPSHGSGQALSLPKGPSRDHLVGIPHIYSASPDSGRQESTIGERRENAGGLGAGPREPPQATGPFDTEVQLD